MTFTTYDTPASMVDGAADLLRAAAVAAGRGLPSADPIVAQPPHLLADAAGLVGSAGAQAVSVTVRGAADGSVALVVAAEVAAALRSGPLGADELVNALTTPVTDAVAALEPMFGGPLEVGIADAVIADAVDFAADAVAVPLAAGEQQLAVLVVDLVGAAVAASAKPPAQAAAEFTAFVEEPTVPSARSLDLLHDVEMAVTVELGRTRMAVRDLLSLAPGAVVELDRAAGSPVDVLVNGKLIARGEVVVIDDDFGIRISEIIGLQTRTP